MAWEYDAREAGRQKKVETGQSSSMGSSKMASRMSKRMGGNLMWTSIDSAQDEGPFPSQANAQVLDWLDGGVKPEKVNAFLLKAVAAKMRRQLHRTNKKIDIYSLVAGAVEDAEGFADSGSQRDLAIRRAGGGLLESDNWEALCSIFVHPVSILLLAFPLGICSQFLGWGDLCTFWLNILALAPLAKILGDGTEELATAIRNDTISGLLNATLGNAVEMIITFQTLRKGLIEVVKATLLGSILSNILLVLGTSFLLGGFVGSSENIGKNHVIYKKDYQQSFCVFEKEQIFSSKSALVSMAMQLLACMTCALPTLFAAGHGEDENQKAILLEVSRISSIVLMMSYVAYVLFQLVTHKRMLTIDEGAEEQGEDDDDEGGGMTAKASLLLMAITTTMIAVSSELLVGAIESVVAKSSISASFIGIVLLPFAGNACEHASAIRFAIQDRPGLSIGIAVGSSTQIALLVVPWAVVMGWILDQPMDLAFGVPNMVVMLLSDLVALALVVDGRANWMKGFMLCTAYVFEAMLYWNSS